MVFSEDTSAREKEEKVADDSVHFKQPEARIEGSKSKAKDDIGTTCDENQEEISPPAIQAVSLDLSQIDSQLDDIVRVQHIKEANAVLAQSTAGSTPFTYLEDWACLTPSDVPSPHSFSEDHKFELELEEPTEILSPESPPSPESPRFLPWFDAAWGEEKKNPRGLSILTESKDLTNLCFYIDISMKAFFPLANLDDLQPNDDPSLNLRRWLRNLMRIVKLPNWILLHALHLLEHLPGLLKFGEPTPFYPHHGLIFGLIILLSKFSIDAHFSSRIWMVASQGLFSKEEVKAIEASIFQSLGMRILLHDTLVFSLFDVLQDKETEFTEWANESESWIKEENQDEESQVELGYAVKIGAKRKAHLIEVQNQWISEQKPRSGVWFVARLEHEIHQCKKIKCPQLEDTQLET